MEKSLTSVSTPARSKQARRRAVGRVLRRVAYSLLAAAVVAGIVIAWLPRRIPVEVAVAQSGPLRVTVDEDGKARIKDRYVVSAPLAGSLARIELEAGDSVKQGEVLARIAPVAPALLDARARATAFARLAQVVAAQRQSRTQIEHAKGIAEFSNTEAERARQLFARDASTQQQLDQAETNQRRANQEYTSQRFAGRVADFEVAMARAAVDRLPGARAGTAQLDVPSPITGRVLKVWHKSEGVVQPGAQLIELGDPLALEVAVDILTSDAARIRPGAQVELDGWGGPLLEGRVRRIEPSAFTQVSALGVEEQRVNLLIDLLSPQAHWAALGDGYRVEAHIVVWAGTVLKVPTSALFRQGAGWALFRVDDGVARLTPVEVGERTAREAAVVRGLSAGQRVIVHPSDRITDGVKVVAQ